MNVQYRGFPTSSSATPTYSYPHSSLKLTCTPADKDRLTKVPADGSSDNSTLSMNQLSLSPHFEVLLKQGLKSNVATKAVMAWDMDYSFISWALADRLGLTIKHVGSKNNKTYLTRIEKGPSVGFIKCLILVDYLGITVEARLRVFYGAPGIDIPIYLGRDFTKTANRTLTSSYSQPQASVRILPMLTLSDIFQCVLSCSSLIVSMAIRDQAPFVRTDQIKDNRIKYMSDFWRALLIGTRKIFPRNTNAAGPPEFTRLAIDECTNSVGSDSSVDNSPDSLSTPESDEWLPEPMDEDIIKAGHPFYQALPTITCSILIRYLVWRSCQGGHEASENSSGNVNGRQSPSRPRKRRRADNSKNNDKRNEDGSPSSSRVRTSDESKSADTRGLSLACPYYKRDKFRYHRCILFDTKRISHVKQHLRRKHLQRHYCPVCGQEFQVPDCLTRDQDHELTTRVDKKMGLEQQWYSVWDTVFPGVERPMSPYIQEPVQGIASSLRQFLREQGATIVADHLQESGEISYDMPREERDLQAVLDTAEYRILNDIVEAFAGHKILCNFFEAFAEERVSNPERTNGQADDLSGRYVALASSESNEAVLSDTLEQHVETSAAGSSIFDAIQCPYSNRNLGEANRQEHGAQTSPQFDLYEAEITAILDPHIDAKADAGSSMFSTDQIPDLNLDFFMTPRVGNNGTLDDPHDFNHGDFLADDYPLDAV
ncbi:uncharacterized protein F4822DRAFT_434918 [Hypoxylon trugodes]|uniref:uncharacterized protein n=1 Tax=Hypoxylon trugodes TaxID=326681 RepID=UPI00218E33C2|nr:uncharacterized protein F4822DRAFT_434918 [Hypoxylon trugodes]KAI1382991.1 hypothetical protein F4822DRAFT_434918 [Hypoxylon trugodes]